MEIPLTVLEQAYKHLNEDGIGKIILNLAEYLKQGYFSRNMDEIETIYFDMIADWTLKRAKGWENKTRKFRENNPKSTT